MTSYQSLVCVYSSSANVSCVVITRCGCRRKLVRRAFKIWWLGSKLLWVFVLVYHPSLQDGQKLKQLSNNNFI